MVLVRVLDGVNHQNGIGNCQVGVPRVEPIQNMQIFSGMYRYTSLIKTFLRLKMRIKGKQKSLHVFVGNETAVSALSSQVKILVRLKSSFLH